MKAVTLGAVLVLVSGLSLAETFTGKLVDAACASKGQSSNQAAQCTPTAATKSFGVELSDGRVLKLDASGNSKAAEAMKSGKAGGQVTISGQLEGQTVKVDSINLQ
jgi:hypothetical protein